MVQHGAALTREAGRAELTEAVASGEHHNLDERMRALCGYALKLTLEPWGVNEADLAPLRVAGLSDRGIVDANQVVAYFNYVNRVADGLGVELEDHWPGERRRPRTYPLRDLALRAGDQLARVPRCAPEALPWISVQQMRDVDRAAIAAGLSLTRMMENAGAALAWMACAMLGGEVAARRIAVLAGPGGNGGGGLVAARRLIGWGADVDVRLASAAEELAPVPLEQLGLLEEMNASVTVGADRLSPPELIIDAILGYSQKGDPRGHAAALIGATHRARVLSLDTPSGLELERGSAGTPAVHAEATLTLALPKATLSLEAARPLVGTLYLADISIPAAVYEHLNIPYRSPFSHGPIVRLS